MMYTNEMKRAFRSITAPKNFTLTIVDNEYFITVRASEPEFMRLTHFERVEAVEYMIKVKKALEDNGATVLLVREGGEEIV